ncbi:hypothetical protein [Hymenobacter cellulosilyticus]|uniref:Uncharacterized protein n=1 Tax=Hymenobacter cellulosilyticus TaxID=2932248 RepID=A0A8T9Q5E4_9BACT|nr:hypothetical protein [Hymenobacter cellulosilyticus]UOQ72737.1 hypothetical protein MUN79_01720 [Hymenobacter cellulosilyticus]
MLVIVALQAGQGLPLYALHAAEANELRFYAGLLLRPPDQRPTPHSRSRSTCPFATNDARSNAACSAHKITSCSKSAGSTGRNTRLVGAGAQN